MTQLPPFIAETLGRAPSDAKLFERALTHGSHGRETYERLEFLGDRVLGLVVAHWLYERFPSEPEGKMSRRYNALVARETCADVGRDLDLPRHIRLGRQAREDHANLSDNVVGDVVEAVLGALFIDGGLEPADRFVRTNWAPFLEEQKRAPVHPKSALQERAAAKNLGVPAYELVSRYGPHHAPRFKVKVTLGRHGEAEAEGASKQEAETAAAAALLEKIS
ncbi:ribonuclease III [Sphingomonas edaphi]|uniref:Ribonuclease 3 n=1 Tax=Sphingomonas edaphi TaxID=2315689 RepID=A0A418PYK2_9SPHN|nr:ribonuclease III [Sphingomonas edaphi]RIX27241.1 ribonuclease III [Sphingomonas edaphi]